MGWFERRREKVAKAVEESYAGYTLYQVMERAVRDDNLYEAMEMLRSWWCANIVNQEEFDEWMKEGKDGHV